jgi:hypothetical protein
LIPVLSLEEICATAGSVSAVLRIEPRETRVDDMLARSVLALRPQLAQHVCKQRGYGRFGDKLIGTTLPHLVEHVAIDLLVADERSLAQADASAQAQAQADASAQPQPGASAQPQPDASAHAQPQTRAWAGTTTWLDQTEGLMRVRISCRAHATEDADRAYAAITRAITLVNNLLAQ